MKLPINNKSDFLLFLSIFKCMSLLVSILACVLNVFNFSSPVVNYILIFSNLSTLIKESQPIIVVLLITYKEELNRIRRKRLAKFVL